MLYAGVTKILNPSWTAESYMKGAKTLPELFNWFSQAQNIGWVNLVNEWGLALLGVSLILGIGVRLSASLGVILMFLYYLPILEFPIVGEHSYIVDEHIIYAAALLFLASVQAGKILGLQNWFSRIPVIGVIS